MSLEKVTLLFSRLPGLGMRSGRRALLHLLKNRDTLLASLLSELKNVHDHLVECRLCGNFDTANPCHICTDPKRESKTICIVEDVGDLWAMERTSAFRGHFHALGGTLSAIQGRGPDDLRIAPLIERLESQPVEEIILALSATIEGQTTAHYIVEQCRPFNIKMTALAHGVPVGGELDYLDEGTLTTALQARRDF